MYKVLKKHCEPDSGMKFHTLLSTGLLSPAEETQCQHTTREHTKSQGYHLLVPFVFLVFPVVPVSFPIKSSLDDLNLELQIYLMSRLKC